MKFVITAMQALMAEVFHLQDCVTYVCNGKEAVEVIQRSVQESQQPDYSPFTLLILDYNMPHLNGLEVI